MSLMDCRVRGLHLPLMAVIRYRGYALLAQSLLPISGASTICYGTGNSGVTLHNSQPRLTRKMQLAGRTLNLKPHTVWDRVGATKEVFHVAADVEGHLGFDGKFYVVDTARVFPPTAHCKTDRYQQAIPKPKGVHLYRLFRPEYVKLNPTPLSSDAFTRLGSSAEQKVRFSVLSIRLSHCLRRTMLK